MIDNLVSIIIPTYNRAHLIGETLDSVLAQTYANWECLVIDDGSTDDTEIVTGGYISKDSRFQYYKRPADRLQGGNAARNYGFELSKGTYINWLDSDDLMSPDCVEKKVAAFTGSTQAVLHKNQYANYALTQFRKGKFEYEEIQDLYYYYAIEAIEIQTCGFMWRREFLEGRVLFDEHLQRYQDNEFHLRMLATKPNIDVVNEVLATIRGGDASQISAKLNVSKKKLFDVFYYRYQTLALKDTVSSEYYKPLLFKIYKKLFWAFYAALTYERNIIKRFKDVFKYYSKLSIVYLNKDVPFKDKLKSHVYIGVILLFGNFLKQNS